MRGETVEDKESEGVGKGEGEGQPSRKKGENVEYFYRKGWGEVNQKGDR